MAYYFQAKQLCVGYQNQPLIQNIEIELKKGEILTLIGSRTVPENPPF